MKTFIVAALAVIMLAAFFSGLITTLNKQSRMEMADCTSRGGALTSTGPRSAPICLSNDGRILKVYGAP